MPIYEFECEECGNRFDELLRAGVENPVCPMCGAHAQRRLSPVSPPSRQPRGAAVRSGEARRREGEAARQERLVEAKRRRAAGEAPPPRRSGGGA